MPFIPAANCVQANVIYQLFGQRVENVWEVRVAGAVDQPAVQEVADNIRAWVEESYNPLISQQATFLLVDAKGISSPSDPVAVSAPAAPIPGGSATNSMPSGTSLAISLRTGLAGRSFRGRKYLFGLATSQVTGNQVGTSYANDFVSAINALIVGLTADAMELVIVSRRSNNADRVAAVVTPVTIAALVDYNVDSQRRRLTGRGQ